MMKLLIQALLLFPVIFCSCTSGPDFKDAPEDSYDYYSGGEKYGNHFCKVQTLTHTASGKKVTLIGMIHTADQDFYKNVDLILDKQDIILEEGIHGLPSFGIHKYFSHYVFYTMMRFTYLQDLNSQGQYLKDRDNTILADMSSDEFAAQGSIYTPAIQLISLPIMALFTEPYYLYERSKQGVIGVFSEEYKRAHTAELRHLTLSNLELADRPGETLLPGIINSRNITLIKKLEEQIARKEVQNIAIPWGASHLPSLETDLLKSGFTKDEDHQWLRTVAVQDYLDNKVEKSKSHYSGMPYIFESEATPRSSTISYLFSSVELTYSDNFSRQSFLYGDLVDNIETGNARYFSILPRIGGKPLLFDYLRREDKSRFRFLWFFSFGEID